jgi:hypothetical protein
MLIIQCGVKMIDLRPPYSQDHFSTPQL